MIKPTLFLLDANSFCYRAFFAVKVSLATSYGQPTGAVFGFINMLNKILKENSPDYVSACFDVSRDTFRKKKFADYKKHRQAMPDELISQIPIIKDIIAAYNFHIFEKEGFEADDIMATIAKKAEDRFKVFFVTGDKDMMQLVDNNSSIYNPYNSESIINKETIRKRFGIEPKNIIDIVSLMGDSVDNIPGVKGIGEKTAISLIKEYGDIDNLLSHINEITPIRIRDMLKQQKDNLILSRELATLDRNVSLDLDFSKLKVTSPDYNRLAGIFKKLEFKSLLKTLPVSSDEFKDNDSVELDKVSEIKRLLAKINNDGVILFFLDMDEDRKLKRIYFLSDNKSYYVTENYYKDLKQIFENDKIKKIGHNLKQVKEVLLKYDIDICGIYFDVMLAAYILNPAQSSYDLDGLVNAYLNDESLEGASFALSILRLWQIFEKALKDKKQDNLFFDIEMPLLSILYDMENNGVKIDLKILANLSKDLDKRIALLIKEIYKISGKTFNINSPKQLRSILFDDLKLPIVKKTKTGPSTNEEVLKKLSDINPLPKLILDYRQLRKLKSTYIDPLPKLISKKDKKLHASFNQTGTQTGRLSCSRPNLQNIPVKTEEGRKVRLAFIPEKTGDLLLSCDYSQIELRVLAHLSSDKNLVNAFKIDKDVHRYTASLIFAVDETEVTEYMRNTAKRVNFGIIYGMTNFGLSKDLNVSYEEAQRFIDQYFVRYPQVKKYIDKTIKGAQDTGFVSTLLGRRRYLDQINSVNNQLKGFAERQAINAPIQGTASDMIKLAMIKIGSNLKKNKFKSRMILQVHDELIFDVRNKELTRLAQLVKSDMENILELSVPVKVDLKAGKNWYKMERVIL